uniref:Uncharacterized protein n=1 Tax=Arundo donax TaxID=35708 RepID=A0A0A8ZYE3_ARUDO
MPCYHPCPSACHQFHSPLLVPICVAWLVTGKSNHVLSLSMSMGPSSCVRKRIMRLLILIV